MAIAALALVDGCAKSPARPANAAVTRDLPATGADTVVPTTKVEPAPPGDLTIDAPAGAAFSSVLGALDRAKGGPFTLSVTGEPTRKTAAIRLPDAADDGLPPPASSGPSALGPPVIEVLPDGSMTWNGVPLRGTAALDGALTRKPMKGALVIIAAGALTPYGPIVDAVIAAQKSGARITISVRFSASGR